MPKIPVVSILMQMDDEQMHSRQISPWEKKSPPPLGVKQQRWSWKQHKTKSLCRWHLECPGRVSSLHTTLSPRFPGVPEASCLQGNSLANHSRFQWIYIYLRNSRQKAEGKIKNCKFLTSASCWHHDKNLIALCSRLISRVRTMGGWLLLTCQYYPG